MDINAIIDLSKALLTPTIAIVALYIAYQQYRLAERNQNIELYDRRMRFYKKTINYLNTVEREYDINEEQYYQWEIEISEAEFLFGAKVVELIADIKSLSDHYILEKKTSSLDKQELEDFLLKIIDEMLTFPSKSIEIFSPYFYSTRVNQTKDIRRYKNKSLLQDKLRKSKITADYDTEAEMPEIPF